jgi:hypothetical protein
VSGRPVDPASGGVDESYDDARAEIDTELGKLMLQTVSPLILKLSLFLVTAVATHLVMSFGQTFLDYKVAHHLIGGKLFRNHINFGHTHYADDHLVSRTYLGDEGNITHFVHRRHANSNFGVIHFFWDKILGTYRMPNAGA